MEINKELLKPFFEVYKLTQDDSINVDYYPLEASAAEHESTLNSSDYQILADEIYENKLKSFVDGSALYYISSEGDLISFSKETLKSSKVQAGPIDSFTIFPNGSVAVLTGKKVTCSLGSFELEISGEELKILKANDTENVVLIQSIGKLKDFNKKIDEKIGEKTTFGFYRVEINENTCNCDLLGWSLSRPSVVFMKDDRILLGTSSGILTEEAGSTMVEMETVASESPTEHFTNVFDEEEAEEEDDELNNCRLSEFYCNELQNLKHFPEFTVSGICVNEFFVAAKHLYDVIVYDFRNSQSPPVHVDTFPAINFIQSGKIDKKFTVLGINFAFIIETNGNIYCYVKPVGGAKVSAQYLIQVDEEIFGFFHDRRPVKDEEVLYLLTKNKIYRIIV